MFGPGRNWDSESTSRNSASLSQRRSSTIMRRANGNTPPKHEMPTLRKPKKRSARLRRAAEEGTADSLIAEIIGDAANRRYFRSSQRTRLSSAETMSPEVNGK